jgi:hypothetical protein
MGRRGTTGHIFWCNGIKACWAAPEDGRHIGVRRGSSIDTVETCTTNKEETTMLQINMADVVAVINSLVPYLVTAGVLLLLESLPSNA